MLPIFFNRFLTNPPVYWNSVTHVLQCLMIQIRARNFLILENNWFSFLLFELEDKVREGAPREEIGKAE